MPITHRIYNFAAGPAVLPMPVLEEIQRDLVALPRVGMSILEISHRSQTLESIMAAAEADIRALAHIPDTYRAVPAGGASLQFSMVPMNLLDADSVADYVDAGVWADKAIEEARKVVRVHIAASTKAERYARIPDQSEMTFSPDAAYVHITSNNTIEGTQYRRLPDVGAVPLVSDTVLGHVQPADRHPAPCASVQGTKNMGPAGVTLVIIREDLVRRAAARKRHCRR
jgi:phosphoserine aminotransferase